MGGEETCFNLGHLPVCTELNDRAFSAPNLKNICCTGYPPALIDLIIPDTSWRRSQREKNFFFFGMVC